MMYCPGAAGHHAQWVIHAHPRLPLHRPLSYVPALGIGASSGGSRLEGELAALRDGTALFAAMHAARHRPDRAVLFVRGPGRAAASYVRRTAKLYRHVFVGDPFGADDPMDDGGPVMEGDMAVYSRCSVHDLSAMSMGDREPLTLLVVEGVSARPMVTSEIGTHLMVDRQGSLVPIQVGRLPVDGPTARGTVRRGCRSASSRRCCASTTLGGRGWNAWTGEERRWTKIPFPWGPVVRIYDERTATLDLRTRTSVAGWPAESDLRTFVAVGLPLGDETD